MEKLLYCINVDIREEEDGLLVPPDLQQLQEELRLTAEHCRLGRQSHVDSCSNSIYQEKPRFQYYNLSRFCFFIAVLPPYLLLDDKLS